MLMTWYFFKFERTCFLILDELSCYCLNILKIEINPKKVMIFPSESKPLDFLGYRISKYKILPRKTQRKIRTALKLNNTQAMSSYKGIVQNTNSALNMYFPLSAS